MVAKDKGSQVIFQNFKDCSKLALDNFWKEIFTKMSQNKFPQGLRYDRNKSTFILGDTKANRVLVDAPEDVRKLYTTSMHIMRDELGMMSNRDVKLRDDIRKSDTEEAERDEAYAASQNDFKKVRPRYVQQQLISNYLQTLQKRYSLNKRETAILNAIIKVGFQFHALSPNDIAFERGKITSIRGLNFDQNAREFTIPEFPTPVFKSERVIVNRFYSVLDKFLKDNLARVKRFDDLSSTSG